MKFKLINAKMYYYFCDEDIDIEIEKILSKIKAIFAECVREVIITTMSVGMSLNITLVELIKRNNGRD